MANSQAARELHAENIVLGAGEIFIDVYKNGAPTGGERYVGDSPGATISVTTERTTIQSSDGAVSRDLVDKVRSVSRSIGFTLQDASIANWALFLIGETEERTAIAAVDSDGAVGAVTGLIPAKSWAPIVDANGTEIGPITLMKATAGASKGQIDATAVTKGTEAGVAATAAAAGTDYEFDERTGRIFNKLDAATSFKVAKGTTAGRTVTRAKVSATAKETICSIRYVEDPTEGAEARNVFAKECNLVPSGEAALKSRDTPQQFAFTATVLDPGGAEPALTIDGVEN